jgi:hypothetical protein
MAYDLFVGKSSKLKDAPELVGQIEFNELQIISRLLLRFDSLFLHKVSIFFEDQSFNSEEIDIALNELLPLLLAEMQEEEKVMLYKLISALSFAKWRGLGLYGVAD